MPSFVSNGPGSRLSRHAVTILSRLCLRGLERRSGPAGFLADRRRPPFLRCRSRRPEFQWKTIPQGAATSLWAATCAPADDVGGLYCEDCHVAAREENPDARYGVRAYALNVDNAKALWALSERMVAEAF